MDEPAGRDLFVPEHIHHVADDLRHVVVMDTYSGEIFGLDNSAAVIWQELAGSGSIQLAADVLTSTYDVDAARARADVEGFVETLVSQNLMARASAVPAGQSG